jgi:RimJ/RimL family protein N-acetyltransferase
MLRVEPSLDPAQLGYRLLRHDDLPLLHRWLNEGPAFQWYGRRPTTFDEVVAKYERRIDGVDHVRPFAITHDGRPIGYVQLYRVRDEPEYAALIDASESAAALDLFIGESDFVFRGLGPAFLRLFLREVVFAGPEVEDCYVDPHPDNAAAIRAYEKAGFRHVRTVEDAYEGMPAYLMRADRAPLGAAAPQLDPASTGYRPLRHDDLPLMHRWLNRGEALRWYGLRSTTLDEIVAEYGPLIDGREPTRPFAITYAGRPIGYVQTYLVRDHPEYAEAIGVPADSAGVDLFIGEDEFLHRGLGTALLRRFLREVIFADERVGRCVLGPDPANAAAIRAYEKIGFRYLKTVRVPDQEAPEYLMEITREEALAQAPGQEPIRSPARPPTTRTASRTSIEAARRTAERRSAVVRSPAS